ncbi:MAG: hypothetical protein ACREOY_04820, partial [Candidatus Dormibacteraceae bacterium]
MKPFAIVAGAAILGLAVTLAVSREREHRRQGILLELLASESAALDLNAWLQLFQSLYGIATPWWKRWLVGQPWLSFELWSQGGSVAARCWCPAQLEGMVSSHLRETLPGLEVKACEAPPTLE